MEAVRLQASLGNLPDSSFAVCGVAEFPDTPLHGNTRLPESRIQQHGRRNQYHGSLGNPI